MHSMIKPTIALALAVFLASGSTIAGTVGKSASDAPSARGLLVPAKLQGSATRNMSTPREFQHGTHLCSADSHCGVGHKCCSGHCQAVATCG